MAVCFSLSSASGWQWDAEDTRIVIDTERSGGISQWEHGDRELVAPGESSTLTATTPEGRVFGFRVNHAEMGEPDGLNLYGSLSDGEANIPAKLTYEISPAGNRVVIVLETGESSHDFEINSFSWTLPLSLQPRKRAYFLGDHGLGWDERYFYQTILKPHTAKIMPEPDRNIWRFFGLDYLGPESARLWKSESENNAPLLIQASRFAAPLVQLYDERGGLTLEYPDMAANTPSALRVDADRGGRVSIQFWPESMPATPVNEVLPGRKKWILSVQASEDAVYNKQTELQERFESQMTPHPNPDLILDEESWLVHTPLDDRSIHYTSGGYPFPQGSLHDASLLRLSVAGTPVPLQTKALAYWPDQSVKWALLTFPIYPGLSVTESEPPYVSLRDGGFLPIELSTESNGTPPGSPGLVITEKDSEEISIDTGPLQINLGKGSDWLRNLSLDGQSILALENHGVELYYQHLVDPEIVFPYNQEATGGTMEKGIFSVENISLEEAGPLRAIVRLEGSTSNKEAPRVLVRLTLHAESARIHITHTFVVRIKDPRKTFISGIGLSLPINEDFRQIAKVGDQVFHAPETRRLSRVQDTISSARLLVWPDGSIHPIRATTHTIPASLELEGGAGSLSIHLRHARQMAPNALSADLDQGILTVEFWPEETAPMDLRRYSDHLQFGQLESGAPEPASKWVENHYYPQDPVYGISRTHEVMLDIARPDDSPSAMALAADFESPPLLYAGWDHYRDSGVTLPSTEVSESPRAWEALTRLTRFFLYHRDLYGWYGFWNFGDFRHRMGGFGFIVPPEILRQMPTESLTQHRIWDNVPINNWGYDNGAYGWTNTEGLPGLFLAQEYLRHGNRRVYFAMEAMARYARDVIVRHEGRWLGRGTRHGVQPWSDGNHEERQTAATEWRHHFLLSGEGRTRDVIDNLYQNVYTRGVVNHHASHSGRLPGLLFYWELTGNPSEAERYRNYVHQFFSPEGIYVSPSVRFPEATKAGEPRLLNSGSQFFHTFGAMHSLLEYYQLTRDEELKAALIKMADVMIQRPTIEERRLGSGDYSWAAVAFAALNSENPEPYRRFLENYLESYGWRGAYQPVTENTTFWSGPYAMMAQVVPLSFYWANWSPYVLLAVGYEPWNPAIAREYQKFEAQGRGVPPRRPSWQSDFDGIPEIDAYLGPQQPWRTHEFE